MTKFKMFSLYFHRLQAAFVVLYSIVPLIFGLINTLMFFRKISWFWKIIIFLGKNYQFPSRTGKFFFTISLCEWIIITMSFPMMPMLSRQKFCERRNWPLNYPCPRILPQVGKYLENWQNKYKYPGELTVFLQFPFAKFPPIPMFSRQNFCSKRNFSFF